MVGVSRNTVRAALASAGPPKYERRPAGSAVDALEDAIRSQLTERREERRPRSCVASSRSCQWAASSRCRSGVGRTSSDLFAKL